MKSAFPTPQALAKYTKESRLGLLWYDRPFGIPTPVAQTFLDGLSRELDRIEHGKVPTKICWFSIMDLYWSGDRWVAYGKRFSNKNPKPVVSKTETLRDGVRSASDNTALTLKSARDVMDAFNSLVEKAVNASSSKLDFGGRGILLINGQDLSLVPQSQVVEIDPLGYIKGLKLKSGEGFSRSRGEGITSLTPELCKILMGKIGSRLIKRNGAFFGRETDQFVVPKGVKILDCKTLNTLAQHRGPLDLSALKSIDSDGAKALSAYAGYLYDRGSKMYREGMFRMGYSLSGLSKLSENEAFELSQFDENAVPSWLKEIELDFFSDILASRIVHDFSGLKEISPEALSHIARLNGTLKLDGLRELNEDHAKVLKVHKGEVSLQGLKTITPETAKILSNMKKCGEYHPEGNSNMACLDLRGLENPDIGIIVELSKLKDRVLILTVKRLTAEIAEAIKSVKIPLDFNYSEYDDRVPKILEKRRDFEFDI